MLNVWRHKTVRLWGIPKPPAMVGKALNARLETSGHVCQQKLKFARKTDLLNPVPAPGNLVPENLAAGYMPNVLVLQVINIPVQVPAMPVAQAPPAVANILSARVQAAMNGSCQQQILNGPDGDVYKCNGEIIAVKTTDMDFYVTMWDITPSMTWGSAMAACREKLFCDNLEGTLPTVEQLRTMYNNKSTLNDLLTSYGGRYISDYSCYWTSVSNGGGSGFRINMSDGTLDGYNGRVNCNVRPILTSW